MPHLNVNGINLYYETTGHGQPLVFIHGLGSSTRDWQDQVAAFSGTYQVTTLDLRGHGQSDKPKGPYSMAMFAADSAGLLDRLGLGTCHLVGLSLGGGVAFQLALDFARQVKTLTIVNSAPIGLEDSPAGRAEVDRRTAIVRQVGMKAMGQALSPNLFPAEGQADLRETFNQRWSENDPDAYLEALLSMVGWSVMPRVGAITCPALILAADQDYTPVALKQSYAALMPKAELVVIPDSHHALPMEKPAEFNRALGDFLARQAG
jgi:3-oxoadipate enol-lactonase